MNQIRTINGAIELLKQQDADTALTESALRRLLKSGEIPSKKVGSKYLVSMDAIYQFLSIGGEYERD